MIIKTGKELKNIEKCLAYIVANVSISNSAGKTDVNVELERFVKRLLNLYYGLSFELASGISSTYPAIDLSDKGARVACQVALTNSVKKLKDTMRNFDRL
ncbi:MULTISPECIES: SMEK domain-containing protein [unclassified Pseudomonas]|uniref:SMEK domain-containing protein n=1 Tax=unclassified Pseudomonas TaxID=196821 RepID=UPI0021175D7C|nr:MULTISPECIES: SMEK domain-containing protein [unclassified Pseudomonas]